jgi:hypothetical protein
VNANDDDVVASQSSSASQKTEINLTASCRMGTRQLKSWLFARLWNALQTVSSIIKHAKEI